MLTFSLIGYVVAKDQAIVSTTQIKDQSISARYLIDDMACIVNGPQRTKPFCKSDIKRSALGSRQVGLTDFDRMMQLSIEELAYQDALHYKIPLDDSVIHSYLDSTSKQNNWTQEDVKNIFQASGYHTFEEGFEQLRVMYGSNAMIDGKVKQNLFIPESEVIAHYNAHPVFEEASFKIQIGFTPFSFNLSKEDILLKIKEATREGLNKLVSWRPPFWLKESEIAEELSFITTMEVGTVSPPREVKEGFEIYSLLKKKDAYIVPLKARYRAIVDELMKPKFERLYTAYKDSLLQKASIIFFEN